MSVLRKTLRLNVLTSAICLIVCGSSGSIDSPANKPLVKSHIATDFKSEHYRPRTPLGRHLLSSNSDWLQHSNVFLPSLQNDRTLLETKVPNAATSLDEQALAGDSNADIRLEYEKRPVIPHSLKYAGLGKRARAVDKRICLVRGVVRGNRGSRSKISAGMKYAGLGKRGGEAAEAISDDQPMQED